MYIKKQKIEIGNFYSTMTYLLNVGLFLVLNWGWTDINIR